MILTVSDKSGFYAKDAHGNLWTCYTIGAANPVFPHWPVVTTTYWRRV